MKKTSVGIGGVLNVDCCRRKIDEHVDSEIWLLCCLIIAVIAWVIL